MLFLLLYYRLLGAVAVLGLAVYGVFFFALVKLIPITLTLPGIAGLVLTIGVAADANIVIFERIKEEARAGRSPLSAIAQGYRKGIATIIDANVITLFTAFILFVLATAGVKGFAFTLGVGTLVSLFTAVLFTQAVLGTLGRTKAFQSPRALGAGPQRVRWHFDFSGASRWFFSLSGCDPDDRRDLVRGQPAEPRHRLHLGLQDHREPPEARHGRPGAKCAGEGRGRTTPPVLRSRASTTRSWARTWSRSRGRSHSSRSTAPRGSPRSSRTRSQKDFGLKGGENGFNTTTVGPTFGAQVAKSAVIAIVFSLLVIAAYMAIRFEPKYAIPVIIALLHDILITGGVYSLTGREVTSGTVAAFLTILGYSMYDTVIVFDRIRENVPRMPRAAFSQIANKSMSEVLTRSLITGISTLFLIPVLYIFGGATLKDFAFAMGIGVLSGAYSSIFIATPVLTHWKEREPAYRARRQRLIDEMGHLPNVPGGERRRQARRPARPRSPGLGRPLPRRRSRRRPLRRWPRGRSPSRSPTTWVGADGAATVREQEPESAPAQGDGGGSSAQREQRRKRQSAPPAQAREASMRRTHCGRPWPDLHLPRQGRGLEYPS